MGADDAAVAIVLVNDARMTALNRIFRKRNRPTDVLAFSAREGPFGDLNSGLLGDVVISTETAFRQAEERGHGTDEEILRLLIHGILHLLGYDHERSPREAGRMRRLERAVRRAFPERVRLLSSLKSS